MILDTSVLFAYFVRADPDHERCAALIDSLSAHEQLVVSPYVIAELGYLLSTRFGPDAETTALRELSSGAWLLAALDAEDLADCATLVERYSRLGIGVTDASLAVLAGRFGGATVATLDRRHFGAVRGVDGAILRLAP